MLASTEGMSRPSSNTNTDRPARSPAGSGATSRSRAGRCSAAAAAVSAAVTACCWAGPAAAAVTIVTGPARAGDQAAGRRLRQDTAPHRGRRRRRHDGEAARRGMREPGGQPRRETRRRGHRDPHPVRRGGVIGVAVGQRQDEAGRRGRDATANSRRGDGPRRGPRRVRHDTMVAFPGSASHQ